MADLIACGLCGRWPDPPDELPITWSMQTSERGIQWVCDDCTRANLRSLEAKLDQDWW